MADELVRFVIKKNKYTLKQKLWKKQIMDKMK